MIHSDDTPLSETTQVGYKTSHTAVRKARRFAVQGLYEWLLTDYRLGELAGGNSPNDIAVRTRATNAMHTVHLAYYHELMREIPPLSDDLFALIAQNLDRPLDRLDVIEKAVLLIGAYELKYSLHIPFKVVIDEAILLNAHFGATDGYKLINAVMDKLAKSLRANEKTSQTAKPKTQKDNSNKADNTQLINAQSTKDDLPDLG